MVLLGDVMVLLRRRHGPMEVQSRKEVDIFRIAATNDQNPACNRHGGVSPTGLRGATNEDSRE